ncbi:MAG: efflux RND transporter periplasmic adaptor subunit [Bacteroidales bacterium]|nr:efflux RND transporter periplasmic adaptor subunit [Bacteroidales bacterium]
MKKKKRLWLWILLGIVALVVLLAVFGHRKSSRYMIDTETVAMGEITQTVTATGVVQPVYKVTVGTQVSGIVKKLYVDYNSIVKKGDLLAELDKSLLQEQVNVNRANMSVATSQRDLAQKDYDRIRTLYNSKAATQQEYDQAEAQLEQARNHLITAQANYDNAVTQLRYAEIYSPIDGIIISKQVEEGQTVQGAYSVPNLFTIAMNMTEMQVEARVDEADIGQVRTGQEVHFKVDAYPDDEFHGIVSQIRMEPQTNNNVVTYVVIINAHNPYEKLFPGMTASVTIVVQRASGLVIPYYSTQITTDPRMIASMTREGYTFDTLSKRDDGHSYVWLKNGRHLRQVGVTLGARTKVSAIVTSGVAEGDTIVSSMFDVVNQRAARKESMFN